MTKADAVRLAMRELDESWTPRTVVAWLDSRGVEVAPTYVSDVARRDERSGKAITTTTTEGGPLRLAAG